MSTPGCQQLPHEVSQSCFWQREFYKHLAHLAHVLSQARESLEVLTEATRGICIQSKLHYIHATVNISLSQAFYTYRSSGGCQRKWFFSDPWPLSLWRKSQTVREQSRLHTVVLGTVQVLPATDVSTQFRNHNPVNNVPWALTRVQVLSDMKAFFARLFIFTILLGQKP